MKSCSLGLTLRLALRLADYRKETGAGRAGANTNLKGAVIFTTFLRLL